MPHASPIVRSSYLRDYRSEQKRLDADAGLVPGRKTNLPYSDAELDFIVNLRQDGKTPRPIALLCNEQFHGGRAIRTSRSIEHALRLRPALVRRRVQKQCVVCKNFFRSSWVQARYCSEECRTVIDREYAAGIYRSDPQRNVLQQTIRVRARTERRWGIILANFGDRCGKCLLTFPREVYDLHHPKGKNSRDSTPSRMIRSATDDDFHKMLTETVLLCANCHRLEHISTKDWAPARNGL
jgi:hypothetical protein